MDVSRCKAAVTHCAASLRYALDGFKNSAGIDVRRGTMFGAVDISTARAFAMVSTTVGRSGCTFIFDMLVGQKPRRLRWGKKAHLGNHPSNQPQSFLALLLYHVLSGWEDEATR
jgi:hypothetical protein